MCVFLNQGSKSICTQAVIIQPVPGCISLMLTHSPRVEGGRKPAPMGDLCYDGSLRARVLECIFACRVTCLCLWLHCMCVFDFLCICVPVSDCGDVVSSRDADPQIEHVNHCD